MGYGLLLQQLIDGRLAMESDESSFKPQLVAASAASGSTRSGKQSRTVAIIPIQGVMFKDDLECGPVGMDTIGSYIRQMDANPNVDAIILNINSPGGTVSGTAQLGAVVASVSKPIFAFVDDLAASAAYWVASQCDMVIASTKRAEVGSIGVMLSFADIQPKLEKEGVKFHEIYSSLSPDKNADFARLRQGNYEQYVKDVLDPLATDFREAVTTGRGDRLTDKGILKGSLVFADKGISIGLVDKIATLDEAIAMALDAAETSDSNNTASHTPINNSMTYPRITGAIGSEFEVTAEGAFFTPEAIDAIENALASDNSETVATLSSTVAQQEETIASRDATIAEHEATIAALREAAGGQSATITSSNDIGVSANQDDVHPMVKELNAVQSTAERLAIIEKYEN